MSYRSINEITNESFDLDQLISKLDKKSDLIPIGWLLRRIRDGEIEIQNLEEQIRPQDQINSPYYPLIKTMLSLNRSGGLLGSPIADLPLKPSIQTYLAILLDYPEILPIDSNEVSGTNISLRDLIEVRATRILRTLGTTGGPHTFLRAIPQMMGDYQFSHRLRDRPDGLYLSYYYLNFDSFLLFVKWGHRANYALKNLIAYSWKLSLGTIEGANGPTSEPIDEKDTSTVISMVACCYLFEYLDQKGFRYLVSNLGEITIPWTMIEFEIGGNSDLVFDSHQQKYFPDNWINQVKKIYQEIFESPSIAKPEDRYHPIDFITRSGEETIEPFNIEAILANPSSDRVDWDRLMDHRSTLKRLGYPLSSPPPRCKSQSYYEQMKNIFGFLSDSPGDINLDLILENEPLYLEQLFDKMGILYTWLSRFDPDHARHSFVRILVEAIYKNPTFVQDILPIIEFDFGNLIMT